MLIYQRVCQKMIFWKIARWTRTPKSLGLSSPSKCLTLGYPWISTIFRQTQNNCHIYIHTPFYIPILLISSWLDIPSFSHKITVISPYFLAKSTPGRTFRMAKEWKASSSCTGCRGHLDFWECLECHSAQIAWFQNIYVYICIHYVYVCMCVCMYVCMDGWMDGWMEGCMYVCMHACMHVCMYMYVCTYVCIHIYIYIQIVIYIYQIMYDKFK